MKIGRDFKYLTYALAALAGLPFLTLEDAVAQISVSGNHTPSTDSFWTSGGSSSTNGIIGNTSDGELEVLNISTLQLQNGTLAQNTGTEGTATVAGLLARWQMAGVLNVGRAGTGTLNIGSGGQVSNNGVAYIGQTATGLGTVLVSTAASWNVNNTLDVGRSGEGNLNIENGGVVTNTSNAFVGRFASGNGAVRVTGSGSQWNNSISLFIGDSGNGTLNIESGGRVNVTQDGFLGYLENSNGLATVSGAGSQWNMQGGLVVGRAGSGTLIIEDGGVVSNQRIGVSPRRALVGWQTGSTGMVTVTGAGSEWNNRTANLDIGNAGSGTLLVENGGVVSSNTGGIGRAATSDGKVTITGSGSEWNSTGAILVGGFGTGTLDIADGGVLTSNSGNIADRDGAMGTVTVTGTDSQWTMTGGLQVGRGGTGILNVEDEAVVTSQGQAFIGRNATGVGTLTVRGTGSEWNTGSGLGNGTALEIGSQGNGTLNLEDGGVVNVTRNTSVARNAGSTGAVTVTGAGSQFNNDISLLVGDSGTGTLSVEAGGKVEVAIDGFLGYEAGSNGTATVTGAGSEWNMQDGFVVGLSGSGSLTVSDGGKVSNRGYTLGSNRAHVGFNNNSTGTVTVTGADSEWNNLGVDLDVGRSGTGELTVADSGQVNVNSGAGIITLGRNGPSSGTLNVGDGGSAGVVNAAEVNGRSGSATLNFNHSDEDYHFTKDGTSGGTAVQITGTTVVNHSGPGTTTIAGNNNYSGGTTIEDGTLKLGTATSAGSGTILIDGGTLNLGGQDIANDISFGASGGTLAGSGTINTSVSLTSTDQVLAPGDSPGVTVYNANQTWESFSYLWELNDWTGTVAGTNFDQIDIAGSLDLTGSESGDYILDLTSLTLADDPGDVANFTEIDQSWIIITASSGITGFDEDYWTFNTSNFTSDPVALGTFSLAQDGNNLVLSYTAIPEPTTGALLLAGLGYMALRRRK